MSNGIDIKSLKKKNCFFSIYKSIANKYYLLQNMYLSVKGNYFNDIKRDFIHLFTIFYGNEQLDKRNLFYLNIFYFIKEFSGQL